jgi:hypothetical protein
MFVFSAMNAFSGSVKSIVTVVNLVNSLYLEIKVYCPIILETPYYIKFGPIYNSITIPFITAPLSALFT